MQGSGTLEGNFYNYQESERLAQLAIMGTKLKAPRETFYTSLHYVTDEFN